ncbi:MAG: adenosylcobinamide-GDP ribazoletransferase [Desulfobacterales bacterium]
MKGLISAIQFITSIPLRLKVVFEPRAMIPFFPVVGLILGGMTAVFDFVALYFWPVYVVAVLDVVLLVVLTGALHLDGLGDTADGLYGRRSREEALRIMKDSRIGAMGLVVIVCVLAVKWAGFASLGPHRMLLIIIVPSLARASMIFGMYFLEYGRPGGGTGHPFFENPLNKKAFIYVVVPSLLCVFAGLRGIGALLFFVLITGGMISFYRKRIGCITGDMLGAMVEISEAGLLIVVSAGGY